MTKGIKISKKNKPVTKGSPNDFYVDTERPLFKLFKPGSGVYRRPTVILGGFTIPHNLGYEPFFVLFMERLPGSKRKLVTHIDELLDAGQLLVTATVDDQNINVDVSGGVANSEYRYNYFIYYDEVING